MRKSKKVIAAALAVTMMMGSTFTAFAAETTGSTQGAGSSEGHVTKKVVNMVLPTIPQGTTPFSYTMDPERLIQETSGARYEDYTFPAKESDTGVYFLVGEKEYANTSKTLQAVNKSSCDVTLTVKVKATENTAKDITLATAATPSATAAELYLGLKVGVNPTVVSKTEQTVTKTIAGTAGNFETVYDSENSVYKYAEKADATTWKAINISMTGAVSEKSIESDTTAPTVEVTWSFAEAADGVSADTADQVDYSSTPATSSVPATVAIPESGDITVPVTIGTDGAEITSLTTSLYAGNMLTMTNGYGATYSNNTITLQSKVASALKQEMNATEVASATFTATFGEGEGAYTQTFKFSK